jgi:hypothetical protein
VRGAGERVQRRRPDRPGLDQPALQREQPDQLLGHRRLAAEGAGPAYQGLGGAELTPVGGRAGDGDQRGHGAVRPSGVRPQVRGPPAGLVVTAPVQPVGDPGRDGSPLGWQQGGQDGVPSKGVPPDQPGAVGREQVRLHPGAQDAEHRRLVHVDHLGQQPVVDLVAGDGCGLQHLPARDGEPVQPVVHQLSQAGGHLEHQLAGAYPAVGGQLQGAALDQPGEQLLDQQRQPVGGAQQRVDHVVGSAAPAQSRSNRAPAPSSRRSSSTTRAPVQAGARGRLAGPPAGGDQHRAGGQAGREPVQQVQGLRVGGVQVLEGEHHRPVVRRGEEREQPLGQHQRCVRRGRGRARLGPAGHQPGQRGAETGAATATPGTAGRATRKGRPR